MSTFVYTESADPSRKRSKRVGFLSDAADSNPEQVDVEGIVKAAEDLYNFGQSIFGGGGRSQSCVQREQEIKQSIRQYLTPSDRAELVRGMESNVAAMPGAMARFFVGGRDCKHKNVGSGDQRFLDALPRRIEQRMLEHQQQLKSPAAAAVAKAGTKLGTPVLIGLGLVIVGGITYAVANNKNKA